MKYEFGCTLNGMIVTEVFEMDEDDDVDEALHEWLLGEVDRWALPVTETEEF